VYSPKAVKGLSVSVDYWNIKQRDLVSSIGSTTILQDVELLGPASQYYSKVRLGSFTGSAVGGPGAISTGVPDNIYVTDQQVNIAAVDLDGYDIAAKYTLNVDSVGRFDFTSNVGVYNHYTVTSLPGTAPFETVGYSTRTNGTIPKWQTYTSIDFNRGNYQAFLGFRYLPKYTIYATGESANAFNTVDLLVAKTFGSEIPYLAGAKISLGVNNVFNKFGNLDPNTFTDSNVDTGTFGAIGRFFYVDAKIKF
jgi:iron complex outermembrane receptor protein